MPRERRSCGLPGFWAGWANQARLRVACGSPEGRATVWVRATLVGLPAVYPPSQANQLPSKGATYGGRLSRWARTVASAGACICQADWTVAPSKLGLISRCAPLPSAHLALSMIPSRRHGNSNESSGVSASSQLNSKRFQPTPWTPRGFPENAHCAGSTGG